MKIVAIQGINGSFHHQAAEIFFKNKEEYEILECNTFKELVKTVGGNGADFGVIAIENSIAGAILNNYKLLTKNSLKIIGEIYLPIHINLIAHKGTKIKDITEIWSHPMAILQSEDFLEKHIDWKILKRNDTSSCAKEIVAKNLSHVAVLASEEAAKLYNLDILKRDVQNKIDSFTRFFIISKNKTDVENSNKASLYFTLEHRAGRLVSILTKMARMNMNLTKIQSIPLAENVHEFSFFVDVVYEKREDFLHSLEELNKITGELVVLGEYKEGKI